MGSPKTSRGALLRPREKDRTRGTLGRSRICSPGWKGPGIQEAAAPLLVSSWGATLAFRTFPRAGPQRLTPGGRRSFAERGGDGGIWATELLTWGGWVFHHPPALFPPRVSQSRIQHHGQLPGGDSMILHIPVLGSPCQCLTPICAEAPVLRPLA
ncbi:uncharacterized protein MIR9-1HG isoform X2 [Zalophus californianus]|uniref:Uncharacterized protein MIR9-1HG isoform X2 n=1 Tax=Zalophus californianus TaxID=9704 RepID=A0A6J2EPN6_ZALCA|nr:uncharacterized protein MIR9-1HG isoform X2 [Zalophus californianus]